MKEHLRSMLNNLINENPDQASLDFHNYLTSLMRQKLGLAEEELSEEEVNEILDSLTEEEIEEAVRAGWQARRDGTGSSLVRPINQAERNQLAKDIRDNRKANKELAAVMANPAAALKMRKQDGESDADFIARRNAVKRGTYGNNGGKLSGSESGNAGQTSNSARVATTKPGSRFSIQGRSASDDGKDL